MPLPLQAIALAVGLSHQVLQPSLTPMALAIHSLQIPRSMPSGAPTLLIPSPITSVVAAERFLRKALSLREQALQLRSVPA